MRPDSELLHDAFEASLIGMAVETLEGQPLFVNPALCSMLGFTAEELCTKHCVQFSPPEDAAKDWALFQQLRAGTIDHYQLEKRHFRRDGSLVWGRLSMSLLSNRPSPLILAMVEDVTEKKKAEEALRASEERLRLAQHAARIGSFERNIETGELTWTEEMESLYGIQPGGFGQTRSAFENLVHPEDRPKVIELLDCALKTGQLTRGEWRVLWADGSVHWIAGRWQVFMNESGAPSRVVGVNMDITERKLAEDKLREYERAVEGSEEMITVVDREYRYLIANRQFLKMRNLSREHVVGHFAHEMLNEGVFEAVVKPKLDECFQGKVIRYEMKYTYPELGERDVLVSYFPIEGSAGVDRVASVVQDITDRKRAEEALLGVSRKLIEAQEQERARIARELHDDIGQRLALLAVALDQLQHEAPALPSDVPNRLRDLQEQTTQISTDLQSMSHALHAPKLEYLGIVAGLRSVCHEFGGRQRVEVRFKSNNLPAPIPPDISLCLVRVLQESLQNAAKHSGTKSIDVELRGSADEIHLIVSDLGKGFDLDQALQSSGLGLTSMQERVRLAKGSIQIQSKPMRGTTIHARVPVVTEFPAARAAG